jgi:ribA/ribD-fused uncharacterized protein
MNQPKESREITSIAILQAAIAAGYRPRYLLFWGHRPRRPGVVDKACLSQWYPAAFTLAGVSYPSAEHYMMAEKARLFGDGEAEAAVLAATHPGAAKRAGREVRGFMEARWVAERFGIVVRGSVAKFGQNPALGEFLRGTGERVLVEASPVDRIWGIGLAGDDPAAEDPARWRGLNLLGFALMEARAVLSN